MNKYKTYKPICSFKVLYFYNNTLTPTLFLCVVFVAWNLFRVSSFICSPFNDVFQRGNRKKSKAQCRACTVHVLNSVVTMFLNRSRIINYIVLTETDVQVRIVALSWSKTPGAPHNNWPGLSLTSLPWPQLGLRLRFSFPPHQTLIL